MLKRPNEYLAFFPIPLAGDGLAFLRHWSWTCLLEEKGEGWNTRQGKPVRDVCCVTEGETGRPESGVSLLHFIHNQCFAEKTLSHQGKKCLSNEQIPVCSKCQWEINHTCLTAYMLGRKWERWIVHLSSRMSSTLLWEESLRWVLDTLLLGFKHPDCLKKEDWGEVPWPVWCRRWDWMI